MEATVSLRRTILTFSQLGKGKGREGKNKEKRRQPMEEHCKGGSFKERKTTNGVE